MNPRNWPDLVQVIVAVIILMGFRFLLCAAGAGVFYLVWSYLDIVPSLGIAIITIGLLVTITGTWQWQIDP